MKTVWMKKVMDSSPLSVQEGAIDAPDKKQREVGSEGFERNVFQDNEWALSSQFFDATMEIGSKARVALEP